MSVTGTPSSGPSGSAEAHRASLAFAAAREAAASRCQNALRTGSRVLSSYRLPGGEKVWIITEAVGDDGRRASTCILTPDEY